mgnify:FL=1
MGDAAFPDARPPLPDTRVAFARAALEAEANAIHAVPLEAEAFAAAVELVLRCGGDDGGSLVVSGLGKSGLIGRKLAATFASTGTPAHFLHPVEAMHGDLGRVRRRDVVLLLSNTGNTEEVVALATLLRQDGVATVAICGSVASDLGRLATCCLPIGDVTEACPHNLAPTASTAAMLALGDALALCASHERGFDREAFSKFHPGGGLGRLLTPVAEAMRFRVGENLEPTPLGTTLREAYEAAEHAARTRGLRRPGALLVVHTDGTLAGIFTDGDLRRHVFHGGSLEAPIGEVMTASPTVLRADGPVREAVQLVREKRIDEVPVVDRGGRPVGLIDVQDLVALKVIEG